MKQVVRFVILSGAVLMMSAPAFAQILDPEGLWLTENERSVIELKKQPDGTLSGQVAWIIGGGMQFDEKNPDASKRGNPMCGLTVVSNLTQGKNDPNGWHKGKIYKADDGDTYDSRLTMQSEDMLEVRGFMGVSFLGKSQTWTRVSAEDYPRCKPAQK